LTYFPTEGLAFSTPFERGLAGEEVAVALDRRNPVRDLPGLGFAPERDLAPVGGDRRGDLGAATFQCCCCRGVDHLRHPDLRVEMHERKTSLGSYDEADWESPAE
jgi:hypothetical protein